MFFCAQDKTDNEFILRNMTILHQKSEPDTLNTSQNIINFASCSKKNLIDYDIIYDRIWQGDQGV